ncbi:flavin reductase (DIM6/NTAB) family NADH-FMN oxidoreductase RutF [Flavobacterium sp. 1]|uniref:flavin reductase family protein n=1 Tax=Flavobacterium sp. 1 TaxID=2035200 RepID=UPI000C24630A|nr:flavin reductase [Flavobacterium sp. 1]PJJ10728.1 flavin reductase (DIM6/NTAB) family NADH-FMN oxidoreductase RutF [Flavobacterium sp. 1]
MKSISKETISQMDKIEKLNLINSCTGFKSANLIATKSIEGNTNVAIFSSVTHLGNSPSLIGIIVRPTTTPRDTYKNIMETGYFTVNHITVDMITDAHHTSANYESGISEFDKTNLEEEYKEGISIPFVKGSPVQLYCKFVNEYNIKENGTIHIIASIESIFYDEALEHKDGWLQLDKGNVVALNGTDGYFLPKLIDRFQQAQQDVPTKPFRKDKE